MKKTLISLMVATLIILMCAACQNQETIIICGNCAARVPESSQYCSGCGAQLFLNQAGTNPADSNQSSTANTDGGAVVGDPTTETIFPDTTPTTEPPSTEPPHSHNYTSKITTNATCTEKGHTTYSCSCGGTYTTDEVAPKGHQWDAGKIIQEATETEDGEIKYTCTVCSEVNLKIIPSAGHVHNYDQVDVTSPTCTEKGYTTHACRCGDSYTDSEVAAKGHRLQDATCTTPNICTVCGSAEGAANGHSWKDATCTAPQTCTICGATDGTAKDHSYTCVVTPPSCTENGYSTHTCKSCGDTYTDSYVDPSHILVKYVCSACNRLIIPQGYTTIDKKEQLSNLSLNGKYILMCDIDMSNAEWTPIGTKDAPFTGVFDGNGHTVKNIKISKETYYGGLFGYNNGTISKLGVEGISISISNTEWDSIYAGAIAGYNGGTITDCYTAGTITARSPAADFYPSYAGGLAGYNTGTITNCYSTCDVAASTLKYRSYAGGLVGYNDGTVFGYNATISNCYATGNIDSRSTTYSSHEAYADAVVGANYSGTVKNCYSNKSSQITEYNGSSAQFGSGPNKHTYAKDVSVLKSVSFQTQTLGWSSSIWQFVDGQHPTLK